MSNYNRKGFTTVRARDPRTDRVFNAAVPVAGGKAAISRGRLRKVEKSRRHQLRQFKENMRAAKKEIPLELRSKVNWSKLA